LAHLNFEAVEAVEAAGGSTPQQLELYIYTEFVAIDPGLKKHFLFSYC
jgi:hypothetical protein